MGEPKRKLLLESDRYAEKLYWDNNYDFDSDLDDSISDLSSGYDSIGSRSDLTSFSSVESCDSFDEPIREALKPEVMQYRSAQSVCDSMKLIISMPELCDVTFLVGPGQVAVHGVRAILGTRSRKFYELILQHLKMVKNEDKSSKRRSKKKTIGNTRSLLDKLVIPVKTYDAEVFRNLVQFVHCGSVNVTEETVAGLYCGACQFELRDLSEACLDFIEGRVKSGNYATLLKFTRNYSQHAASKEIFNKIRSEMGRRYKTYKEISV